MQGAHQGWQHLLSLDPAQRLNDGFAYFAIRIHRQCQEMLDRLRAVFRPDPFDGFLASASPSGFKLLDGPPLCHDCQSVFDRFVSASFTAGEAQTRPLFIED
jgi:hypothetical protein